MQSVLYIFHENLTPEISGLARKYGLELHFEVSENLTVLINLINMFHSGQLNQLHILKAERATVTLNILKILCSSTIPPLAILEIDHTGQIEPIHSLIDNCLLIQSPPQVDLNIKQIRKKGAQRNNKNRLKKYKQYDESFLRKYFHLKTKNMTYREMAKELEVSIGTITYLKNKILNNQIQLPM